MISRTSAASQPSISDPCNCQDGQDLAPGVVVLEASQYPGALTVFCAPPTWLSAFSLCYLLLPLGPDLNLMPRKNRYEQPVGQADICPYCLICDEVEA